MLQAGCEGLMSLVDREALNIINVTAGCMSVFDVTVCLTSLISKIDWEGLMSQVDWEGLMSQVDCEGLMSQVDWEGLMSQVDWEDLFH